MNIEFRLRPHRIRPNVQLVEVWKDGVYMGNVTPGGEDTGALLHFTSKHPTTGIVEHHGQQPYLVLIFVTPLDRQ